MPDPSVSTEPVSADPGTPPAEISVRRGKGSQDNEARTMALVVGLLVGTFIGIRIGNAARKRMDRWSPCYLCLSGHAAQIAESHPLEGEDPLARRRQDQQTKDP